MFFNIFPVIGEALPGHLECSPAACVLILQFTLKTVVLKHVLKHVLKQHVFLSKKQCFFPFCFFVQNYRAFVAI